MIAGYEEAFAEFVGVPHAYAFWKGRAALYAILRAIGIRTGDEVLVPGFTCVVVPNAVRFARGAPAYVDIAAQSYNVDPIAVERAITRRTRALIVQHTFGIPADLDPLLDIARRNHLTIIEDCAHAVGSTYGGRPVGTFGQAAFFSSQWSKPFTTGLGGVAVTSDPGLAEQLRRIQEGFATPLRSRLLRLRIQYALYRSAFSPRSYWLGASLLRHLSRWNLFVGSSGPDELGGMRPNDTEWRMSPFQARLGGEALRRLSENLQHRRRIAEFYERCVQAEGWGSGQRLKQGDTVYVRYPLRVANKAEVLRRAAAQRIELGDWFESVLHPLQGSLDRFGYQRGRCPVGERAARETVNLAVHPGVTMEEAERIVKFVFRVAAKPARVN